MKKKSESLTLPTYNLRKREHKSVLEYYNLDDQDLDNPFMDSSEYRQKKKRSKKKRKNSEQDYEGIFTSNLVHINSDSEYESNIFDENVVFDRLPDNIVHLKDLLNDVKHKTKYYKQLFIKEQ